MGHALAIEAFADEVLDALLADNDRAAVQNDNEVLPPGKGAEAVGLTAAMGQTEVENDGAEKRADVLK